MLFVLFFHEMTRLNRPSKILKNALFLFSRSPLPEMTPLNRPSKTSAICVLAIRNFTVFFFSYCGLYFSRQPKQLITNNYPARRTMFAPTLKRKTNWKLFRMWYKSASGIKTRCPSFGSEFQVTFIISSRMTFRYSATPHERQTPLNSSYVRLVTWRRSHVY